MLIIFNIHLNLAAEIQQLMLLVTNLEMKQLMTLVCGP
jgi:hypothetical protein